MTKADTVAVIQLIDHFFSYIENDQLTDAIGMLYYLPADDHYSEPQLLDNEQLAKTRAAFSLFPIVDHRIDYVKFSEVYSNEVKATAIIEKGEEGKPEICTSIYFKPVNFLGSWRLCVMDTNSGDHSIVDSNSKDSLTGAFSSLKDSLIMR